MIIFCFETQPEKHFFHFIFIKLSISLESRHALKENSWLSEL